MNNYGMEPERSLAVGATTLPTSYPQTDALQLRYLEMLQRYPQIVYPLGIDRAERERMIFEHYVLSKFFEKYREKGEDLHKGEFAPLHAHPHLQRILDIGCGTGTWCLETARRFKSASVRGFDITTPRVNIELPHNCCIHEANMLLEWSYEGKPYEDGMADYIHMRGLGFAVQAHRWFPLAQEAFRCASPGGWLESMETDYTFLSKDERGNGEQTKLIMIWLKQAMNSVGVNLTEVQMLHAHFRDAGFEESSMMHAALIMPLYAYDEKTDLARTNMLQLLWNMRTFVLENARVKAAAYDHAFAHLEQEWLERRTYVRYFVTLARKPLQLEPAG